MAEHVGGLRFARPSPTGYASIVLIIVDGEGVMVGERYAREGYQRGAGQRPRRTCIEAESMPPKRMGTCGSLATTVRAIMRGPGLENVLPAATRQRPHAGEDDIVMVASFVYNRRVRYSDQEEPE